MQFLQRIPHAEDRTAMKLCQNQKVETYSLSVSQQEIAQMRSMDTHATVCLVTPGSTVKLT